MTTVTVSPKFQIVIPKEVREAMHLKPGMKMDLIVYGNVIELVPVVPIEKLIGTLKGINSDNIREEKDRII